MTDPNGVRASGTAMVSDGHSAWRQVRSAAGAVVLPAPVRLARIGVALVVPIAVASEMYQQRYEPLRWRSALALALAGCALAVAFRWREFPRAAWRTLFAVFAATLVLAAGVAQNTGQVS